MLSQINSFLGNYTHITEAISAFCPLVMAIIMAIIAYEQYKINQYLEYTKVHNEISEKLNNNVETYIKRITETLTCEDKTIDKQAELIKISSEIKAGVVSYEHLFEYSDVQLIKESYAELEKWIKETKNWKPSIKSLHRAFDVITNFIAFAWYADSCFIKQPNKNITLYSFIGATIKRIYTFFVPYFIQKNIKKWFCPKLFKIKACFFLLSLAIKCIKNVIESFKDKEKQDEQKIYNKTKQAEVIENNEVKTTTIVTT
ncbi:hypothetical protein IKL64_02875 [bacterium]|nr:hypothetical protein [bacterium]